MSALEQQLYVKSVSLKEASLSHTYYEEIPAIQWLRRQGSLDFKAPLTFFVGENGTGKSTLLEAMAVAAGFNPEGGSRDFRFSTRNSHSDLWGQMRLTRGYRRPKNGFFLRAESFYNVASEIDRLDRELPLLDQYGGVSLHEQSHGESFLSLIRHRFGPESLFFLDEPEAALSPTGQLSLLASISQLVEEGCQFFIATHSPILICCPGAQVLEFLPEGLVDIPYNETSHFRLMKSFLSDPERMLSLLLEG